MSLNLNEKSYEILAELRGRGSIDVIEFETSGGKATILDVGVNSKVDDQNTGIKVAEASMGGLGKVEISEKKINVEIPEKVSIATLSCQLAGWAIEIHGKNALCSGPGRILSKKPKELVDKVGYYEETEKAALILETNFLPDEKTCEKILEATKAKKLIIAAFQENSKVGLVNIMARVVELGVFRLNTLGYDTCKINYAKGEVPLLKLSNNIMFTANDALIYSSKVLFKVNGWNKKLTEKTISRTSKLYGKSFKEIFEETGGDFYKIPADIFAPAEVKIIDLESKEEYFAGLRNKTDF